jgi:porphobilinogen deaminase
MEFEGQGLFVSDLVELLPAAGQGAIGLEVRANDLEIKPDRDLRQPCSNLVLYRR